ncbi:MAG: IPTL-CTERM sorting domain-containing protein [Planctomycetes bacterium]|nr:IPTL-CTERM sorting domain-containing protein [Planctomycetota bacterium]MBI3834526.1 IPTL-CTERM sorting domain-containing protein [Planctomycetota bacterium]
MLPSQCACPHCQWSNGQSCSKVGCHNDRVPTISHWGVAILSLLLLIAAKIRFCRKPRSA